MRKLLVASAILVGVYFTIANWGAFVGATRYVPYHQLRTNRLHAIANEVSNNEGNAVEQALGDNPDTNAVRDAAQQLNAVKIERQQTDRQIDGDISKACPAGPQHSGNKITLDISGCAVGQFLLIPLFNLLADDTYSVQMYLHGKPIAAKPQISVVHDDQFSEAVVVSDPDDVSTVDMRLRGFLKLVPNGDADYVEFVLHK
ncbi:MAG: hypothetical protein P4L74_00130 [Candidatus Doudnabacteria bacterium]|nr:hypothetical protein [Candidatus Doudnabacteria bacterium]